MTQRVPFVAEHLAVGIDLNGEGRNLPFGTLIDGSAMRYIPKEGMETGESGYRELVVLGTNVKVDVLFGGKSKLTKSLWGKSGTKIFHTLQTGGVKYDIGLTLTATEINFFLEGYNGDIFTFNQTDSPVRVATAALLADTANDSGVINVGLGTIDKFAASGTVYVRGSPVTYSGKSGGTLTGLTGIPAGGVFTGDLLTQTSTPASFAVAKGTCGMIIEGSMLVAGVKGSENVVYQSAPSTLDNPEFLWDFTDNGANSSILDNPVTAMIRGTALGYILGESFVKSTPGFDIETNVLVMNDVTNQFGAYNPYCVADMGGRMVLLGNKRLIPTNVFLAGGVTPQAKVDEDFDIPVQPWLDQFDTDQGRTPFLSYNANGTLTIAGKIDGRLKVRRFDARKNLKIFTPEDVRPAQAYTYFDGKSYFGNNSVDKVYVDNTGFTNDGFPILHRARTSRMEDRKGRREILFDYIDYDGFMSKGCVHTFNVYTEGSFETPIYSLTIDDSVITSKKGKPISMLTPGSSVPGGDVSITPTFKFPFKVTIDLTGINGEDIAIEWVCSKLGGYLQVKSFIMEGDGVRFSSRDRY